jgi:hypothetical protein
MTQSIEQRERSAQAQRRTFPHRGGDQLNSEILFAAVTNRRAAQAGA